MGVVEFSEADIQRIQRAFRVDRDAAVLRLEEGSNRSQRLVDESRRTDETVVGSEGLQPAPIDVDGS